MVMHSWKNMDYTIRNNYLPLGFDVILMWAITGPFLGAISDRYLHLHNDPLLLLTTPTYSTLLCYVAMLPLTKKIIAN